MSVNALISLFERKFAQCEPNGKSLNAVGVIKLTESRTRSTMCWLRAVWIGQHSNPSFILKRLVINLHTYISLIDAIKTLQTCSNLFRLTHRIVQDARQIVSKETNILQPTQGWTKGERISILHRFHFVQRWKYRQRDMRCAPSINTNANQVTGLKILSSYTLVEFWMQIPSSRIPPIDRTQNAILTANQNVQCWRVCWKRAISRHRWWHLSTRASHT